MAGAVYWIGADGNIYYGSGVAGAGVKNEGLAEYPGDLAGSFTARGGSGKATQIADPNRASASVAAPSNPNNTGSGAAATTLANKSGDITLQNAGLTAADQAASAEKASTAATLGSILSGYGSDATTAHSSYQTNSDQNQNNLQKNKQTSLVNAAQGRQGIFSTLASLGALNGSGITLANNAVQHGANEDLNGAESTFGTNQVGLDTGIHTFDDDNKKRTDAANAAAASNNTAADNNAAQTKLTAYKALADDYTAQGDAANASKYTGLAAGILPTIASTSAPAVALQADHSVAYTPASLASYIAGSNPSSVVTTPGTLATGGVPGLVTDPTKKKQAVPVATASA